ncbi:30S ribosomal protein S13 [Turneriella parva]|jgi:small subunit ribosomal protein S13|uniref:Small ribosomal subunit protein uS13 n=1 Tax=Turneriella parva (strain ATCC BAA-1111 / DSM 21527 / NCTC 11395 / H) TaxID=869212 RepID=I4B7F6_TURPD|nr:30S ribosomal protein S13 [Turneriella parva]AFM13213.1 SSU ribosomal protein S13P [Turneriella parva DSM 21527]
MARIEGIDLPNQKRVVIGLTYIYGIGDKVAHDIVTKAGIPLAKRVHELSEDEVGKIKKIIDAEYTVEGALRSKVQLDMKRLVDTGSYRGSRHRKGLPARGQRTKTNARTRKGRRLTVAGKKSAPSKG